MAYQHDANFLLTLPDDVIAKLEPLLKMRTRDVVDAEEHNAGVIQAYRIGVEFWLSAWDTVRDAILNERFQLAEGGCTNTQINSVLGILDDNDPRRLEVARG